MSWGARKSGFVALDAKLDGLKELAGEDVATRALMAAGEPVAATARAIVRVGRGTLRDSIQVGTKLSPRQAALAGDDGTTHVYVGPGPEPEAITEEFGTVHEAPHPFLRPAWDAEQGAALEAATAVYEAECSRIAGG